MKKKRLSRSPMVSDEYLKNEYRTNKVISIFILGFVVIGIVNGSLSKMGLANDIYDVYRYVLYPCDFVLVILVALSWIYKCKAPWVKYLLLSSSILITFISFFIFTTYVMYLLFIPIFVSTRYFEKKTIVVMSSISAALFLLTCILAVELDSVSASVRLLHDNIAYNTWQTYQDAVIFVMIPCTISMAFLAIFSVNMTSSAHRFIAAKIKNSEQISAVNAELSMAAQIQKSALPPSDYQTSDQSFRVFAYESPAKEVCGDFYDYFMLDDHTMAVLVADVSDKGAPAAMFMMSAKKVMQCAMASRSNLEDAISLANKLLCQDNECGMFLTMWMGIIDTKSGLGKYVNAGHPFPLLRHVDGTISRIENEPDLFLGSFPDNNPKVHSFRMIPGDTLLLFTDGLTDAANLAGHSLGLEPIENCLARCEGTARELGNRIISVASSFSEGKEPFDDITILSLQCIKTEVPREISLSVESSIEGTAAVSESLQQLLRSEGCPDEKRRNIAVAVDEICCNISDHGYDCGGTIFFHATVGSNFAELTFEDTAFPFDPLSHEDPVISDTPQFGGLGIFLVKQLSDKLSYEYADGKNKLTILFIWNI